MNTLPPEIIRKILFKLSPEKVLLTCKTCKKIYNLKFHYHTFPYLLWYNITASKRVDKKEIEWAKYSKFLLFLLDDIFNMDKVNSKIKLCAKNYYHFSLYSHIKLLNRRQYSSIILVEPNTIKTSLDKKSNIAIRDLKNTPYLHRLKSVYYAYALCY